MCRADEELSGRSTYHSRDVATQGHPIYHRRSERERNSFGFSEFRLCRKGIATVQVKDLSLTPIGTARSGPSLKRGVMWAVNSPECQKANHIRTGRRAQKRRQQPTAANKPDPCGCRRRRSDQRLTWLYARRPLFFGYFRWRWCRALAGRC